MHRAPKGTMPDAAFVCCCMSIMVKPPESGLVKTRLARALGDDLAVQLAAAFLRDTLAMVQQLSWAMPVLSTTDPQAPFFADLRPLPVLYSQGEGDLGQRLARTLAHGLATAPMAMVLAADSPGLPVAYLEQAYQTLLTHDAVLGPAMDGGFYLLGLRRLEPGLLADLPWSSPLTGQATGQRLVSRGYRVGWLEPWFDVDDPADLQRLEQELRSGRLCSPHTEQVLLGRHS